MSGVNGSLAQPSPGGTTSRWPAKAKCGAPAPRRGEQILDRPVRRLAEGEAVDREAERRQRLFEHVEHGAARGRDARAGDQPGGEVDGVDCGGHRTRLASRHGETPCPSSTSTRSNRSTAPAIRRPTTRRWRSGIIAGSRPPAGLEDFGVSHVVLEPGGISSQRHWHEGEDELVVMLDGRGGAGRGGGRDGAARRRLRGVPQGRRQRPSSRQPLGRALHLRRRRQAGRERLPLSRHRPASRRRQRRLHPQGRRSPYA